MNNSEFVALRDRALIAHCRQRLPGLIAECNRLRDEIEAAERTMKARELDDAKRDKQGLWYQLQYADSQRAEIERILAIAEEVGK
jgi:hypothetical protein